MRSSRIHWKTLIFLCSFLFAIHVFAQNNVRGIVKDDTGRPLVGASVQPKSAKNGTLTDEAGRYTLKLPAGAYTLVITYVGMQNVEVPIEVAAGDNAVPDVSLKAGGALQEVVVLGSRSSVMRSSTETVAPVDVISSRDLIATGRTEPTQMLNVIAPSFNSSRQNISDGTDHIDPATLRGLGPDQVLVLLNGKRRHNQALINVNGTIGRGSVGTDLNSIPPSAIEKIEVLRDGASSQYGSDAIAGVINIDLKKAKGTTITSQLGQNYEGDGEVAQIGINHGFVFKNNGFINLSGDFRYRGASNQADTYQGPVYVNWNVSRASGQSDADFIAHKVALYRQDSALVTQNKFSREHNLSVGNSLLRNAGFVVNAGTDLGKSGNTEFYFTGSVNYRNGQSPGNYRYPYQTSQVITELYPNGFLPQIHSEIWDRSVIAGLRFITGGWKWDISNTYGGNSFRFDVNNSNNASQYLLGAAAPTSFYAGTIKFNQNTADIDVTKDFGKQVGLQSFNVAAGAEYRLDNYQIIAGEEASYKNYDTSSVNKRVGGAQVFPGFQPANAVDKSRNVFGVYLDLESDITKQLLVDVAGRFENYSDFGNNFAGKFAFRYKFADAFSLRGSISNGFRAPSIQQRYFSTVSTVFVSQGGQLVPQQTGTFPNNSKLAQDFGIPSLTAEKSTNYSVGVTSQPVQNLAITIDGYFIRIDDRIVLTGSFSRATNSTVNDLLSAYPDVNSVQFFTNAVNTETKGIDAVITYKVNHVGRGNLDLSLSGNLNKTNVVGDVKGTTKIPADSVGNVLFSRQERSRLELAQPRSKFTFGVTYRLDKFSANVRVTHYGRVSIYNASTTALDETYSPKVVTDLNLSYKITKAISIVAGANNIFDVYPDRIQHTAYSTPYSAASPLDNSSFGRLDYSLSVTQFGFTGGYYFAGINARF